MSILTPFRRSTASPPAGPVGPAAPGLARWRIYLDPGAPYTPGQLAAAVGDSDIRPLDPAGELPSDADVVVAFAPGPGWISARLAASPGVQLVAVAPVSGYDPTPLFDEGAATVLPGTTLAEDAARLRALLRRVPGGCRLRERPDRAPRCAP